jgi:hypothetical protein
MENAEAYPVTLSIDYPEKERDRLTVALRMFAIIPIAIILGLLFSSGNSGSECEEGGRTVAYGVGFVVAPTVLMILFRQKYPRWWFDWNVALANFGNRVGAYGLLLRDEYPSTDEEQAVHLTIPYPNVKEELNRWLPLVKVFLALPHWIVLACLLVGVIAATIVAWFIILFTGVYPRGLFDFVVGVRRWGLRVFGYAVLMVTDVYPPFSLTA